MQHVLKIGVSNKTPPGEGIVRYRKIDVRFTRWLFGEKRRLTILVPGDSVKSLSIFEEGGDGGD